MQRACSLTADDRSTGGVICDASVFDRCGRALAFDDLGEINVKGKVVPIRIYRPYPPDLLVKPPPMTPGTAVTGFRDDNAHDLAERMMVSPF